MKEKKITIDIALPAGVTAQAEAGTLTMEGPKGEVRRALRYPSVEIGVRDARVFVTSDQATAREKKALNTFEAHIKNMIQGVTEGHTYKLKICSGHFPMNVAVTGKEFIIKNFLGEKHARTLAISPGVTVNVQGQEVIVEGTALETVSQCAANIEKLTAVRNRDRRIFQDGIYIIIKDGQPIE